MAFAAAVYKGTKQLADCPRLEQEIITTIQARLPEVRDLLSEQLQHLAPLRKEIQDMDLQQAAMRVGGKYINGNLTIKCLGKDFTITQNGELTSQCHINTWVHTPILAYVAHSLGRIPTGEWINFGKLKEGRALDQFFHKRCPEPLKILIDAQPDLFWDLTNMFAAQEVTGIASADQAIVLHPLPKLPMLICYWQAEDDLESQLNVLFDRTAANNIDVKSIYMLATGMVEMFQKIILAHSEP